MIIIHNLHVCVVSILQTPMKKTKALIGEAGATFVNAVSMSKSLLMEIMQIYSSRALKYKYRAINVHERPL